MVQPLVRGDVVEGSERTGLRVYRSVDAAIDACGMKRACTHRARLERHVHGAALKSPVPEHARGLTYGNEFGMRSGVRVDLTTVRTACDDFALEYDNGTDGYLSDSGSRTRFVERHGHVRLVGLHAHMVLRGVRYAFGGAVLSVRFKGMIYQYGGHARLDIPTDISRVFNEKGYISVRGSMNGKGIRGTLVPISGGRHVIYVNEPMAARAGIGIGDSVDVVLDRDLDSRKPLPQELADALAADSTVKTLWENAEPAFRKRAIAYLGWFNTPRTRERKVEKVLRDLRRTS